MKKAKYLTHRTVLYNYPPIENLKEKKKRNHKAEFTQVFQQLLNPTLNLRDCGPKSNLGHVWMKSPTESQCFSTRGKGDILDCHT